LSKNKIFSFRIFKTITIILFIYFGIVIIKDSNTLFYFPHIGRTFVFVMIVSIASLIFFDRYQVKHEIIEREQAITTQNILKEKEYLNKYNDSIDEIRTMRHDMHNTLHIIHGYLEAEQTSEATEYVCHLLGIMNNSSALVHIGIPCIDSVFDDKLKIMNKKNIKYTEHIAHVNIGCIERNSLAILIGLALDNAIEAAEKVEHNRFIKVEMKNSQQYLILRITNSIILGSRPNFYKTSKLTDSMNHGFGVKEIKHIASQYNGDVKYDTNDDNVILKVILNTSEKEDQS
jgi:two-component system sensor histidine kinase AgrC